jgi:hypothetical protein
MADDKYESKYSMHFEPGSNPTIFNDAHIEVKGDFYTTSVRRKPAEEGKPTGTEESPRIGGKFSDLFAKDCLDRAKGVYAAKVQPLIQSADPDKNFLHAKSFVPLQRYENGDKVKADAIYKAFGELKSFLSDELSEKDYATWLASHVAGKDSVSSWQRYL